MLKLFITLYVSSFYKSKNTLKSVREKETSRLALPPTPTPHPILSRLAQQQAQAYSDTHLWLRGPVFGWDRLGQTLADSDDFSVSSSLCQPRPPPTMSLISAQYLKADPDVVLGKARATQQPYTASTQQSAAPHSTGRHTRT